MSGFPCAFGCAATFPDWRAARAHVGTCPKRKARLALLGTDLVAKVQGGRLTLDEAEREQAKRPSFAL